MPDNMSAEQRSRTMSRIRSSNTQIEMVVRRLLFKRGLRYRLHLKSLSGKPDLVFPGARVVVFLDGDFWHGWKFDEWKHKLQKPWRKKIERNRARDLEHTRHLEDAGWQVLRIWEHEIKADAVACADRIEDAVKAGRAANTRTRRQKYST